MKKYFFAIACIISLFGCAASNVNDLRNKPKIHKSYISNDSLQNVYSALIKKYNECGIPVSSNFINTENGEAAISYNVVGQGWYAHADITLQSDSSVKIDAYSQFGFGIPADFVNITEYAVKKIPGCPK